ncbi:TlpA family protein disulfide reductase [Neolewinella agarilytica]|uniref:TlpA family protein disulfide reductase n=1 Tax=Neolewinella agarilytica TaxID=478744 RepID=UPI0023549614|nr:TlpA disulfide reductase family protein [Neolewinella agarilytica]
MKHLSTILLLAILFACHSTPPMPEYSYRDELQSSTIHLQLEDFDASVDPLGITLFWYPWHTQDQKSINLTADRSGRFTFETTANVVTNYSLILGSKIYDLVLPPGEDLTIRLVRKDDGTFVFKSPENPLTEQIGEMISIVAPLDWEAINEKLGGSTDPDTILAVNQQIATQRLARLDSLRKANTYDNPLVYVYGEEFIKNKVRYDFNVQALQKGMSSGQEELSRLLIPTAGTVVAEKPVYNYEEINDLSYQAMALTHECYLQTKSMKGQARKDRYYELYRKAIDSVYSGFGRDVLYARFYDRQIMVEPTATGLIEDLENFLRQTPYPALRVPLREKLSVLKGEKSAHNQYIQQIEELSNEEDNPIPAILEKHKGKVVLIDFWGTWCSPCVSELKNYYPAFAKKYDADQVALVFLAVKSPENIWRKQISELTFSAEHHQLNEAQRATLSNLFGISGFPHHTLFDQSGKLVMAKVGGPGNGLEAQVDKLLD